jgi:glyoxylase-like metal-dependent hydrolase (beta-lactamase superfamily II)
VLSAVPVFLIEHPKGLVLVDTGLNPGVRADPLGYWGEAARMVRPSLAEGEDVAAQLKRRGFDPSRVRYVINTHLHVDHAGGNPLVPKGQYLIRREESEAAYDASGKSQVGTYIRGEFDHRDRHVLVDSDELDLYGDRSIIVLKTAGHTQGHQSVMLRFAGNRKVVLAGDACFMKEQLATQEVPGFVWDAGAYRSSLARLAELAARDCALFVAGHDPLEWERLPESYI